jgi:hypothetical protein
MGSLPASIPPELMFRVLSSALIGVAVMQLSDRLAPGEDADALARDVLDVTLAGLRTAPPIHSSLAGCSLDSPAVSIPDSHVSSQEHPQ